jgi:hypothetical protein
LPTPPPELGRLYVEDWISAADFEPDWVGDPTMLDEWAWAAIYEAMRRWQVARRAWLDANEIPLGREADVIASSCGPEFRDRAAFQNELAATMASQQHEFRPGFSWRAGTVSRVRRCPGA